MCKLRHNIRNTGLSLGKFGTLMFRFISVCLLLVFCLSGIVPASAQQQVYILKKDGEVNTGSTQMDKYLPELEGKRVALITNQTSVVGTKTLLLDTLLSRGVHVVKIFTPEHGLRGMAGAGETVKNDTDAKTGLPIISLYGKLKKPTKAHLADVDIVVYDLQDVGVRFFTYISTLQYAMEACAEYGKKFMILDRPNPNGFYVDGPVLDTSLRSFVGMQPIPVVYGMTAGEYAKMLVGERWFKDADKLDLTVIPCVNYDHKVLYELPVVPSPNLRTMAAIYCYPSICLFEGTVVSVGRGTSNPFQQFGHPDFYGKTGYSFRPVPQLGGPEPLYAYRDCFGQIVALTDQEALTLLRGYMKTLWLVRAYGWYPYKEKFFNNFFEKLAGTKELRKQVEAGMSDEQIHATWQDGIRAFKQIRKKYLLYKDFE